MNQFDGACKRYLQPAEAISINDCRSGFASRFALLGLLALALAMPIMSHAGSQTGTTNGRASLDFRIVIPAVIRVSAVTQPDYIIIDDQHIMRGYIDLNASTVVKITNNTRNGYRLNARFDTQFLTKVEVKISGQNLTASLGTGSMHVSTGIAFDKLVAISYRLHLAPGVGAGQYRWPVALAFSLASV